MNKKRIVLNLLTTLVLQLISIISGFITPKLILLAYGTKTNGLIISISQFLNVISFLEFGMGAVVQSSLYKPLYKKDNDTISKIIVSADKYFKRIGIILVYYVMILMAFYPLMKKGTFDYFYISILIFAISISYFSQYYFGIVDGLLISADQKGYIINIASISTIVLTTLLSYIEIKLGFSVQLVKFTSSIIFLIKPYVLNRYVKRHYQLNRQVKYSEEPIKQKWNALGQHISAIVLDGTDTIVLTLFSTLENVSIYGVYNLVVYGIKNLFLTITNGTIQAVLGELWAKNQIEETSKYFSLIEWTIHTLVVVVFCCCAVLLVPFISVYTKDVFDANYIQPVFSMLIVLANGLHCLRLPYHMMIKAGGMYKETQNSYYLSSILNILISVFAVKLLGLNGVVVGTLLSMLFQTIWMAHFCYSEVLKQSINGFIKQFVVDIISFTISVMLCSSLRLSSINYGSWVYMAIKVFVISVLISIIINCCFCKETIKRFISEIKRK